MVVRMHRGFVDVMEHELLRRRVDARTRRGEHVLPAELALRVRELFAERVWQVDAATSGAQLGAMALRDALHLEPEMARHPPREQRRPVLRALPRRTMI